MFTISGQKHITVTVYGNINIIVLRFGCFIARYVMDVMR